MIDLNEEQLAAVAEFKAQWPRAKVRKHYPYCSDWRDVLIVAWCNDWPEQRGMLRQVRNSWEVEDMVAALGELPL